MSASLNARIEEARAQALAALSSARNPADLEKVRVEYLGRSQGRLRDLLTALKDLPAEDRRAAGAKINALKEDLAGALSGRAEQLGRSGGSSAAGGADLTQPGLARQVGHLHVISQTLEAIKDVFGALGFSPVEGPEVETERHNFDALNIPKDHPARDSFDTFFLSCGLLLRSHTSPAQVRVMESQAPPVRVIVPGRVYRPDAVDATHFYCFHQCEGLMVDEGVSFSDLRAVLTMGMEGLLGAGTKLRFRPSFFPFTEPSAEVDVSCIFCKGAGCKVCKQSGWVELLGAGLVNPAVFEAVGYDTERYTGFAFGIGVERLAMFRYGINDIRLFLENDVRFLEQF
ncbi:MAG TPA: phenylalanine--tRNA ligase subunit alpha [Planctomycetota bacterium]|nr:phenylalanine--tRNA ligase subunit alpha [Planctomycetota bacterium]